MMNAAELGDEIADRVRELGLTVQASDDVKHDLHARTREGTALVVQVKRLDRLPPPGLVERLREQVAPRTLVLGLPHVTPHLGEQLRAAGIAYVDAAGNAWLDTPGTHIHVEGRRMSTPLPRAAELSPSALRVTFALLVAPPLADMPVRAVAAAAGVSTGSAQKALHALRAHGHLGDGRRTHLIDPPRLATTWLGAYAARLHPRLAQAEHTGPEPRWWIEHRDRLGGGLAGEAALESLGAGLRAESTTLYGTPPWGALRTQGRLRPPHDVGPRVVVRERFWSPDLAPDGATVPPLLVVADARTSASSRVHEAARHLWEDSDALRHLR